MIEKELVNEKKEFSEFFLNIRKSLFKVAESKHDFLNKFNKYIFKPNRDVFDGFAVFMFWVSKYLKG